MIYGIGTDMVAIKRIEALYKKYGQAFAERILHQAELMEWQTAAQPVNFLAKRFAAKEAFAKAVGTGVRGAVTLRNVGVGHDLAGRPEYVYTPALQAWLDEQGIRVVHLSMSDENDQVMAFAVAEK
ncbi:holo-ACP synthase [Neisseria sp.]|uniref:holo-ACP synthase n=1 Tax=Neisseria sp. TaxID=192066 RepID=UPI002898F8A8|nr:holo-ACP synthase [Neisseria sp.]